MELKLTQEKIRVKHPDPDAALSKYEYMNCYISNTGQKYVYLNKEYWEVKLDVNDKSSEYGTYAVVDFKLALPKKAERLFFKTFAYLVLGVIIFNFIGWIFFGAELSHFGKVLVAIAVLGIIGSMIG
jgi:hypothetical protein